MDWLEAHREATKCLPAIIIEEVAETAEQIQTGLKRIRRELQHLKMLQEATHNVAQEREHLITRAANVADAARRLSG